MIKINNSSIIDGVKWEDDTMTVYFKKGTIYEYYDVDYQTYYKILISESRGKYLHKNIIKGDYKYKKIK